jgi:hypothetical protein
MSDTSSAIVIDLKSSNHSQPVAVGSQLIQGVAYENLHGKLNEDIKQAQDLAKTTAKQRSVDDDEYPYGNGLTYFIDGTRGAGKSTFLRYAYQHLGLQGKDERQDPHNDVTNDRAVNVLPLMYLDPSRIESSEHVLLHILKRLKHLAKCCQDRSAAGEREQANFRKSFQDLAGGLHVLSGKKSGLDDLDAELFLDHGLERAADSQRLRSKLHSVIGSVCTMYGADALVLAIDDADTKAELAMEVLECLRKYLDTPQIVALVTGDLEMYSLLVQNHFQQDFASQDKGLNPDRKKQQTRMVEHLEDQYLLKLFPIQRRIQLKTLHTLSEKHRYTVKATGIEAGLPLNNAIDRIAADGLRLRRDADKRLFRQHVLKLPVRSVLQLLSIYFKYTGTGKIRTTDAASEALRAIALSSLYRHDVDVERIAEGDLYAAIDAAFDLSLLDGDPDTAAYLRPQARDLSLRNCYTSLSADVARLCDGNPARAITYLLSTAGSISLYYRVEKLQANARSISELDSTEIQKKFKQYLAIGRAESALNWSWHATATLIGATKSSIYALRQGIVGVRSGTKTKDKTIDGQLQVALELKQAADRPYPAIAFSQSGVKQYGNTQRYLSIFNTLGLIANLLALEIQDAKKLPDEIRSQLNTVLNIPTVSLPNWKESSGPDTEDDEAPPHEHDDLTNAAMKAGLDVLVEKLVAWLTTCDLLKQEFHPSALLLGKIWNRLYFSLDSISSHLRSNSTKLNSERCAKSMELFAWALINACLVEEFEYHYLNSEISRDSINKKNPVTSGEPVIIKLKDVQPSRAPLTFMIASCPLVLGLICVKSGRKDNTPDDFVNYLQTTIKDHLKQDINLNNLTCSEDVWDEVAKIVVSGVGAKPPNNPTRNDENPTEKETSEQPPAAGRKRRKSAVQKGQPAESDTGEAE